MKARGVGVWVRAVRWLVIATAPLAACQVVAGVDFDKAHLADGLDGSTSAAPDADAVPLPDTGDAGPQTSACTPDPNVVTCADRCGPTEDNCKASRGCASDCGGGKACVIGKCECVSEGSWCANRCGQTEDNCGRPVSCGGCDGGIACTSTACGCTPEPKVKTCGTQSCGTAVNNCNQVVACGTGGACTSPGAICKPDGSCCTDNGAACQARCGGVTVTNNCAQTVGCPAQCPATQVCIGTNCCIPEPLATTCSKTACGPKTNNCGQTVTCPNTCVAPNTCGGGVAGVNGCGCTAINPCGTRCSGTLTNNCGAAVVCSASCSLAGMCPCAGGSCATSGFCACRGGACL